MIDEVLSRIGFKTLENWMSGSLSEQIPVLDDLRAYEDSRRSGSNGVRYMAVRDAEGDRLLILGSREGDGAVPATFVGTVRDEGNRRLMTAPQNGENARALREHFPHTAPSTAGAHRRSFGLGDRLGLASPGHIPLFRDGEVVPVLAQQSLRELDLMGRDYTEVIDAASWAVFNTGFEGAWVADGDHLKSVDAVVSALKQGCTMITADLSDHLAFDYMDADIQTVTSAYRHLDSGLRNNIEEKFSSDVRLADGSVLVFDPETRQRIALTYDRALDHAADLYQACRGVKREFDFEISIDETDLPTTPEAHYFVAKELLARGISFSSLAPRFVGEFQKGIDYIGDVEEFASSFALHALIAADMGYKISIHSSSDKFSVYPVIGSLVKGAYHLKTSGTNWLVALETISRINPIFFREIFTRAYDVFPAARSYYHITPDMKLSTDITTLEDSELPDVFANPTDRQVLHVSYGELFKDAGLKAQFFQQIKKSIELYWNALKSHIGRHLELLEG
ncbi:MAG: tagaturonate epimerase family protein [Spirochaetaceae bacterium]|nr:tagaturonate epimerase family protein [Spirochaetaceae bacterium]